MRLKQGVGRLIRTRTDRGAVLVLDDRLLTRRYGRTLQDALPPMPLARGTLERGQGARSGLLRSRVDSVGPGRANTGSARPESQNPPTLVCLPMKKVLGFLAGLFLLSLAAGAARTASIGWGGGHSDVGFWWTVIAGFLTIAALGALVGTAIHSRRVD